MVRPIQTFDGHTHYCIQVIGEEVMVVLQQAVETLEIAKMSTTEE